MKQENSRTRKRSFGTTMGITSIISILVILVLVVFSALSLITAKADLNLSQTTSENIRAYYEADGYAEAIVSEVSQLIETQETGILNDNNKMQTDQVFAKGRDYEYNSSNRTLKFAVSIDRSRILDVEVLFDTNGNITNRPLWHVKPAKEWKSDDKLQLFQP